jgi:hypothetical protein
MNTDQGRYKVIRYSESGRRKVIYKNLTLADAQRICSDPETSSNGKLPQGRNWFYGYTSY